MSKLRDNIPVFKEKERETSHVCPVDQEVAGQIQVWSLYYVMLSFHNQESVKKVYFLHHTIKIK